MMKMDEFRNMTDLHSADLSRWPQEKIHAALALMEKDAAARSYFDEMLAIDSALRAADIVETKSASELEARIMEKVSGMAQERPGAGEWSWNPAHLFAPGSGLLAAALIGFIMGFSPLSVQDNGIADMLYADEQVIEGDTIMFEGEIF